MADIIADIKDRGHLFQSSIDFFFQKLNISSLLSRSNFYKEAGFSCTQIQKEFFSLVFTGKNLTELFRQRVLNDHSERIPLIFFSTADISTEKNPCIWS